MPATRILSIAMWSAVAFSSLSTAFKAAAQPDPGVVVRMDALEMRTTETRPSRPQKNAITKQERLPAQVTYIDEESTWIPPPAPPPETIESGGVLQCVPFARFLSGIALKGDAWTWWEKAAGIYARGGLPEPGAILSFPGNDRMPLGHVAVVTQVLNARKILIDHANWPNAVVQHGAISRDIQVVDVSAANDWTEVRVQFGEGGPLGSVYPANGFIYEWNEAGVRIAQPRFSLDYALWSPAAPSVRMFNAVAYLWALPPAERKKAYAAAGVVPNAPAAPKGRPLLVLGGIGKGFNDGPLGHVIAVNRLDAGTHGRGIYVMQ